MRRRTFTLALATASVCTLAPLPAQEAGQAASSIRKRTAYEDLQLFGQVLNQIHVNQSRLDRFARQAPSSPRSKGWCGRRIRTRT